MSNASNADIWIAGAFAAFTVDLLVYPLDTLKTRLQSPDYKKLYTDGTSKTVNRAFFRGVYQGLGSVVIATLPSSGAFFTTYEGVKSSLGNQAGHTQLLPAPIIHSIASASAELVSCAILTPAEVIKQNAQMVDNSDSSRPRVNATIQTIKRFRSNPLALWRGYTALASRNLPFTALQFPIFERLRDSIKSYREQKGLRTDSLYENGLVTAAAAGIAGSFAAVVTTPVDVVKTRIMLAAAEGAADAAQAPSKVQPADAKSRLIQEPGRLSKDALVDATGKAMQSAKDTAIDAKEQVKDAIKNVTVPPTKQSSVRIARQIVAESGAKGLFRGGALRGVWTMLGSGLYLGVYESGRIYLAERRGEKPDIDDI